MIKYFPIIPLFLTSLFCFGQKNVKWGSYSQEEEEMRFCSFDPEASAYILYEKGVLDYQYGAFTYKVHRRIKIFDDEALELGVIKIKYNPEVEKISNIEGITTNFPQGKKRSIKLRSDQIEKKDLLPNESEVIIKMPGVRQGSIIEYRYEKKIKELDKPEDWFFQHDYPTQYSGYEQINIPRDFVFFTELQGRRLLTKYKDIGRFDYELTNIPSLSGKIDFINSAADFVEKIEFRTGENSDSQSWLRFKDRYIQSLTVDEILRKGPAMAKLEIKEMNISQDVSTSLQAREIYRKMQQQYRWSGQLSAYPDGKMNSAEINLQLFTLLKQINLRTYVVLLSTPAHGSVHKKFPKSDPFDHAIVKMVFNEKVFYLDATDPFLPFGYLPPYSDQRDGFQIGEDYGWTVTKGHPKGKETTFQVVSFDNGSLHKQYDVKWDMITSARLRTQEQDGIEAHIRNTFSIPATRQVNDYQVLQREDLKKNLTTRFADQIEHFLSGQEKVYLNPVPYTLLLVNPFTEKERFYPIQFELLPQLQFTSIIDVPAGYQLSNLPEASNIALPEGFGRFVYRAIEQQGKINLTIKFELLKNDIPSRLYPAVKDFYDTVSEKCEEVIIFQKL